MSIHFVPPPEFMNEIVQSTNEIAGIRLHYLRKDKALGKLFEAGIFWELWMGSVMEHMYEPGSDMIDVGAHIGTQTICMAELACRSGGKVHAFEPVYYPMVLLNTQGYSECVNVYPFGVGETNSMISTCIHPWNSEEELNFGATSLDPSLCDPEKIALYAGSYGPVELPIVSLDNARSIITKHVSVVKIDVEGMELQVLRGMKRLIEEDRPFIILEIWKQRLQTFLESDDSNWLMTMYSMFKPNPDMFSQCKICDEDYILVPNARRAEIEANPKFILAQLFETKESQEEHS